MGDQQRINLDEPRYDQSNFYGRLQHFLGITDWRLCFKTDQELNEAKDLLRKYRLGQEPPGTTEEQIWFAKRLYESAFHPDTGDKQNVIGRMSFQVPGGMILTGAMLTFYKSTPAVVFWQWANQSFNALVNYTNRNAKSQLTEQQMAVAYVSATSAALVTALGLKKSLAKRASTLMQRFVPFAAVAAANCINIPLMRQNEIQKGITVCDDKGNELGESKLAAVKGITQVVVSRIIMAAPGMTILPLVMERLEKQAWLRRNPRLNAPFQTLTCGLILTFMTPTACSLFNQKCSLSTSTLSKYEPEVYAAMQNKCEGKVPETVYFNKGL
ncbi:sideroflexin-2-like [Penaeus chinensis]|uniref:sideroflexin-2-like n=1 Tax=Penaeus chinensis TaxID=139456 RepID=UPI001FB6D0E0|nr:sideroflexin-2-like [Penaeus chinensis]XP_047468637.1 sideroflexin-2-like [Penaeus chinensis]XP_047468638.1 sideroflexin-2-like [Penaeus chinensis]